VSRYIPRIEGLENREHLDAALLASAPELTCAPALEANESHDHALLLPAGVSSAADGVLADAWSDGWLFLENYARKAIRNDEQRYGLLPDHDDLVHDVYLELWESVGTSDTALANLLESESAQRESLRKAVRRVIDHARYEHGKNRNIVSVTEQSSPVDEAQSEWLDFRIDVDTGVAGLTARQKQVLFLRGEGKTVEEIGSEIGLPKQRVSEVCRQTIESLRKFYELEPTLG
jgi:RNA polymerase sigma factor (sigma-70 family)